jgi:TIR domain
VWDGQITPGQEWLTQIEAALNSARVAVLLVSPNFLASQFILNVELPTILNHAKTGGVVPFWCLVRDCMWQPIFPPNPKRQKPVKGLNLLHKPF